MFEYSGRKEFKQVFKIGDKAKIGRDHLLGYYLRMICLILMLITLQAWSLDLKKTVSFDGMIDTYYAYDLNRPRKNERAYTTQPAKHNELNLNLGYLAGQYRTDKTRARLAIQAGHSVDKNTLMETSPKILQEAYIGKNIGKETWIDGGIYLGHIGAESWISKENWTYTRALNLDYVPYYSAGLRLSHKINEIKSFQLHLMNGWQNMAENNQAKAIGLQYHHLLTPDLAFTYNNFFGDEEIVPNKTSKFRPRFRGYHNFILRWTQNERWQYLVAMDFGHVAQQDNSGIDGMGAATLTIRRILNQQQSLAFRLETYQDPHEVNVLTPSRKGFSVSGASLNFDQKINNNALWRTEIRNFQSQKRIFPYQNELRHSDTFIVTSLSFWI